MTEQSLREQMTTLGLSLFERGYGCGTSGNLSARLHDGGFLLSPTNAALGKLKPDDLTRLDAAGRHVDGLSATKEAWLHLAIYQARPDLCAIVHLHSTFAVALSCLSGRDPANILPPITPYAVMRFGEVPLLPYCRPGDASQTELVTRLARNHRAIMLANHGPVVAGPDLISAMASAEELEEAAKLYFILHGHPHNVLSASQIAELHDVFGK
jgi:3-dehydro-4-phosphotetronate decarboxylase